MTLTCNMIQWCTWPYGLICLLWLFVLLIDNKNPTLTMMVERWLHTRHTNGMSCWRYFVLCMSVNLQHDTPTCRVTTYANTKYLQHDIPMVCRVCSHLLTIVLNAFTAILTFSFLPPLHNINLTILSWQMLKRDEYHRLSQLYTLAPLETIVWYMKP